ncbi:patatin family protein [Cyanobium sp. NIES-981]|uniref:patatin family protein n=1 Tax=Cyanobium sp. NIES-981 TaxID=1851505 RepID=UPI000B363BE9|nr:patatin family protein [Cyanobium sp. NIES-981]
MKQVGLALGSGGARGWAHIGVIRALQEEGIGISGIAGASIGALVGAIHCAGELDDLEDFVRDLCWRDLLTYFDMVFPSSGLLDGNRVYELLSEHMQAMRIEDAAIPFCCVATDLIRGEEVQLRSGCMVDAVRASIAVPGIFTPFCDGDRFLGDGGIVNPVPVDVARDLGAELVLAVNLNRRRVSGGRAESAQPSAVGQANSQEAMEPVRSAEASHRRETFLRRLQQRFESLQDTLNDKVDQWLDAEDPAPNIFEVIGTSLNVMEQQVTRGRLQVHVPDLLVEPPLQDVAIFDFHQAGRIIELGHRAMRDQLPALRELL